MQLTDFNALSPAEAARIAAVWAAIPAWVDGVVTGRPYRTIGDLEATATGLAAAWTDRDLDAALAHHPRIGQRTEGDGADARASASEQAAVADATAALHAAITDANAAYESRFGRVFLVRAAGRTAAQILGEAHRRLGNDDDAELREALDALHEIALLRIRSDLTEEAPA